MLWGFPLTRYVKRSQPADSNVGIESGLALSQSFSPCPKSARTASVSPSVLMPYPPNIRRATQFNNALGDKVGMRHLLSRVRRKLGRDRGGVNACSQCSVQRRNHAVSYTHLR